LLTFATVLLCAFVVSYVANAEDYKEKAGSYTQQLQQARQRTGAANKDLENAKNQFTQRESSLQKQITDARNQLRDATSELNKQKAEMARLLDEADKWTALADSFQKTQNDQGELLKTTQQELDKARAEGVKLKKQLDETSVALLERDAVIKQMQNKVKALEEEKAELLGRVNQPLKAIGREAARPMPTTVPQGMSTATLPVRDIDLKALVTAVDMKNSMAGISVGSVDGVSKGMRFHVTRGDQFICDILVISVDVEESVGVLELLQQQPMVGDSASTNL
jgi:uncharacterized phage infection (PIP) family protein YhgE